MKLLQLQLRDLFWLILVGALAAAWWAARNDSLASQAAATAADQRATATESTVMLQAQRQKQIERAIFKAGLIVHDREDQRTKQVVDTILVSRDDSSIGRASRNRE